LKLRRTSSLTIANMTNFKLVSGFKPKGDQPQAIKQLTAGVKDGNKWQTLVGVTGSGKTFTMANVVNKIQRPTLVISHNKTLAAQLASEFQEFFPNNAVHYFVSYYDYYQPEAYIPKSDTYIEKETEINEEIDKLRNAATMSLLSRPDVLIVASVSCIYGLGNPDNYLELSLEFKVGLNFAREKLLRRLVDLQYHRNDLELRRGSFRVRGQIVEVVPADRDQVMRISFDGDKIEAIELYDVLTGDIVDEFKEFKLFPAKHFITPREKMLLAVENIRDELAERVAYFKKKDQLIEAQRIEQRTNFDVEMMLEAGYVNGVENYSRHLDGRPADTPPSTLLDYFPDDFLLFIDESHMTVPQIRGMYEGDRSRKKMLIDYGFRLPSAYDNRPLKFEEFLKRINQTVFVSATPEKYELSMSKPRFVEQIIRPTGLLDPTVEIVPSKGQIEDVLARVRQRIEKKQRVLITTLTKKMAEELSEYIAEEGVKVTYLHSEIDTLQRIEILRDLRSGIYDVLVGVNLLREGLDLPEVSLILILDADKEGFLRSDTSLIQLMGRAARHMEGSIVMYADRETGSMKRAIEEVTRRRKIQQAYNKKHKITPTSIIKALGETRLSGMKKEIKEEPEQLELNFGRLDRKQQAYYLEELRDQMDLAAKNLDFEQAANLRDKISTLKQLRSKKKHRV